MSRPSKLNLTQADVDRMIRLRAEGATYSKIAKEYNVSINVVYRYTRRIKVVGQLTPGQLQLVKETEDAIAMLEQGIPIKRVAFIQHSCVDTIRKRIVAYKENRGTYALIKK